MNGNNPFMGFHTNFNPQTGEVTESGWRNKEIVLIHVSENIDQYNVFDFDVYSSKELTEVFLKGESSLQLKGDLLSQCRDQVSYSVVLLEVKDIEKLKEISKSYFKKSIGPFLQNDSPIGSWFNYKKRNEVLAENAFNEMIKRGLYSHLIPIINMPFTKGIFQHGKLDIDSNDLFLRVTKKPLKIKRKGA